MQRRFGFTLIIIFILFMQTFGRNVSESQIQTIAGRFVQKHMAVGTIAERHIQNIKTLPYVPIKANINIVKLYPAGFIVMSDDSDLPPVIAYSFNENWDTIQNEENLFMRMIRDNLNYLTKKISETPPDIIQRNNQAWQTVLSKSSVETEAAKFMQWPEPGSTTTGGWVETLWKQREPYNDMCPVDPDKGIRSPTGCVANTMAQIINYHKQIGDFQLMPSDRYYLSDMKIDDDSTRLDFPSFNKLNSFLDSIRIKYEGGSILNNKDIAALNFVCGISMNMFYNYNESGTTGDFTYVLRDRMGYPTAAYYHVDSLFYQHLKENMMNGLPAGLIIYRSEDMAGHALVVDGYNTDGFYHLNFGSGGGWPKAINDAWYLLPKQLDAGFDIIDGANLDINSHSDDLIFDPVNLSFTTVFKDEIPKIKPINILNTGNMTLQVNCRLVSDNFIMGLSDSVLENENLTLTLNPGRMKTLYIQFIADTVGVTSTDLILSYSDLPVVQTLPIIGTVIPNIGTAVNHRYVSGKWEKSQSPFFVCTDIEIEKGKTLIIEPGTDIQFLGPYSFNIPKDTRLVAEGTKEDSILFQAALGHTWSGFNFLSSGYDDLLSHCLISGIGRNLNTNGIYIWQSYPVFNNVKILKNVSSGSLLRLKKSAARFYNVSIINNYTLTNSIMQIDGYFPNRTYDSDNFSQTSRSPELRNTLITGNSSGNYTISVNNSSPSFINSIISYNKSDTKDGPAGALNVSATDSHLSFINSILAPNETHSGPVLVSESSTGYLTFSYSNVDTNDISWANAKRNMNGLNWGVGNITTDPLFTNAVENDFTLKTGSPCIDAGNPSQEYSDPVNPEKPGYALWPAMGTGRNDMGIYGGGMVSTNKPDNQADQFYLHQNYPNPFNSETTIEFSLPEKRDVSIIIYNTLGQKVKSFYYPEVFKGTYKIRWDGRDMHGVPVGSGLYFYILKSRTHIETRKLIILK